MRHSTIPEKEWAWDMLKNKAGWVMSDVSIFIEKIEELEKRIAELEHANLRTSLP